MHDSAQAVARRDDRGGARWQLGVVLTMLLAALWTARSVAPGAVDGGQFNADAAVPLWMMRAPTHTGFDLFYWGQDRFGGWPFLLGRLCVTLGGPRFAWTFDRLCTVETISLALALGLALPRRVAGGGVLVLLVWATLASDALVRRVLFDVSLPYALQFALLAWVWALLRDVGGRLREGRRPGSRLDATLLLVNVLAYWLSPLSAGFVVCFVLAESLRSRLGIRHALALVLPVVLAWACTQVLHGIHTDAARSHGWQLANTEFGLDLAHARAHLATTWQRHLRGGIGPVWIAGALMACMTAVRPFLRRTLHDDDALWFAAPFGLAGLGYLAVILLTDWASRNHDAPRYVGPALFACLLATVGLGVSWTSRVLPASGTVWRTTGRILAIVVLVAGMRSLSPGVPSEGRRQAEAAARTLERVAGAEILVGRYETPYLLTVLQTASPMAPLVAWPGLDRMPWIQRRLDVDRTAWVALEEPAHPTPLATPVVFPHHRLTCDGGPRVRAGPWLFARCDVARRSDGP